MPARECRQSKPAAPIDSSSGCANTARTPGTAPLYRAPELHRLWLGTLPHMWWLAWLWLAWLVGGLALLGLELHSHAFFAFFLAIGTFGAAVAVALVSGRWWPSVVVFAGLSTAGLALVRPVFVRAVEHRQGPPLVLPGASGSGTLVGQPALTLDAVGDEHHPGHAQLAGERWLAVTEAPGGLGPDTAVKVVAVRGTTLVVMPMGGA